MKLNIITIICIRITNLCDSGTFWETLESHPHFKGLDSHKDFGSSSSPSFHFVNKFVHENRLSLKGLVSHTTIIFRLVVKIPRT
jgi:hypothetical protein